MKNFGFSLLIFNLILVFSLGIASCKKEEDNLPPQTFEGKNTLGCLVNGNEWIPTTDDFLFPGVVGSDYTVSKGNFVVGGSISTKSLKQTISLVVNNFSEVPKEYILQNSSSQLNSDSAFGIFYNFSPGPEKRYYTNKLNQGKLIISQIDSVERIASGRFEFEGLDTLSGETIKVTSGRFDVRYNRFK